MIKSEGRLFAGLVPCQDIADLSLRISEHGIHVLATADDAVAGAGKGILYLSETGDTRIECILAQFFEENGHDRVVQEGLRFDKILLGLQQPGSVKRFLRKKIESRPRESAPSNEGAPLD